MKQIVAVTKSLWVLLLAFGFVFLGKGINANADSTYVPTESIYTLKVEVKLNCGEAVEVGLLSAEDASYLFLPSGTKSWNFCNLDTGDTVSTENSTLAFYNASTGETETRPFELMESTNVGSVFLDTEGIGRSVLDSERKVKYPAEITIFNEDGTLNATDSLQFIRTRGNGTFNTVKKAYEIKFENKTSVLGMPKAKRWILLANFYDASLVRNALVYDFASQYTDLQSEDGKFADVYIDGEYRGNYYLCEKVEVGKTRVNITDQDDEDADTTDITGGYLVNLMPDNLLYDCDAYFTTNGGYNYEIKSPENPTEEQIAYIKGIFDELEEAAASDDGIAASTGRHYSEILDLNSYAEKYLLEETFINTDLDYNSQYYYKDSDSVDSKLYCGPVWDYDMAIKNDAEPYVFENYYLSEDLLKFEDVKTLVQEKYETIFKPYIQKNLKDDLDKYGQILEKSYAMNSVKYFDEMNDFSYGYATYSANAEYIYDKLNERLTYMDEYLYDRVDYATVQYGGTSVIKSVGETLGLITESTHNWYQIFGGWKDSKTGEKLSKDTIVTDDIVADPIYVNLSYLMTSDVEKIKGDGVDVSGMDPGDLDKIAKVLERMKADE